MQQLLGKIQVTDINLPNDICDCKWRDEITGTSPLLLAIQCGNFKAAEIMLFYKYATINSLINNEKYPIKGDKSKEKKNISKLCSIFEKKSDNKGEEYFVTFIHLLIAKNKLRLIKKILSESSKDESMKRKLANYLDLQMKCRLKYTKSQKSSEEYVTCLEYALLMRRANIAKELLSFAKQTGSLIAATRVEKLVFIAVRSDMHHKMSLEIITSLENHEWFTNWENIKNLLEVAVKSGNSYLVQDIFKKFENSLMHINKTDLKKFINPVFNSKEESFVFDFIDNYMFKHLEMPHFLLTTKADRNVIVLAIINGFCSVTKKFIDNACENSNGLLLVKLLNLLLECAAENTCFDIIKVLFAKIETIKSDHAEIGKMKIYHQFWHKVICNTTPNNDDCHQFSKCVFEEYRLIKQHVINEMQTLSILLAAVEYDNLLALEFVLEERNLEEKTAENSKIISKCFRLACDQGKTGAIKLLLKHVDISTKENILFFHRCIRSFSLKEKLEQSDIDLLKELCNLSQNHKLGENIDNSLTLLDVVDSCGRKAIDSVVDAINPKEIINVFKTPSMPIRRSLTRIMLHLANNKPEVYEALFQRFDDDKLKYLNDVIVARKVKTTDGNFTYEMTTPLHIFSEKQDTNMLVKMVQNNADLLAVDSNGDTVLHLLVKLSALRKDKEMEYLKLTNTILNTYLNKIVSSSITDKRERCHIAFIILTRLFVNRQSMSVVSYALYHKATAMLEFLLTATAESIAKCNEDAFNSVNKPVYDFDVTGLCKETLPTNVNNRQLFEELSLVVNNSDDDMRNKQNDDEWKEENILASYPPIKPLQNMHLNENCSFLDILADISFNKSEFVDVLKIPVVRQLVSKYNRQYRLVMMLVLSVHILAMVYATSVAVLQTLPTDLTSTSGNESILPLDLCQQESSDNDIYHLIIIVIYNISAFIVHFYFVLCTLFRNHQMQNLFKDSLKISKMKYIGILCFTLCFQVIPIIIWLFLRLLCSSAQPYVISLYLGFGWVFTIFHMKSFKDLHIFTSALISVMKKVCLFFVSIVIFLPIGLGCALYVLLAYPPAIYGNSSNIGEQIVYLAAKLSLNLGGFFDADNTVENNDVVRIMFIQIIYLICVVLTTVLVLNLIIAMMNDRYQMAKENQKLNWHIRSLRRAQHLRHAFPCIPKWLSNLKLLCCKCWKVRNFEEKKCYTSTQSCLTFFTYKLKQKGEKKKQISLEDVMAKVESIEKMLNLMLKT